MLLDRGRLHVQAVRDKRPFFSHLDDVWFRAARDEADGFHGTSCQSARCLITKLFSLVGVWGPHTFWSETFIPPS